MVSLLYLTQVQDGTKHILKKFKELDKKSASYGQGKYSNAFHKLIYYTHCVNVFKLAGIS